MAKGIAGSTPTGENKPVKTTFVSTYSRMAKIKYVAFMQGKDVSSIINDAFDKIIAKYEKEHGDISIK
jgi:ABC-type glycerol-3-phosphate transport system substrate-binding protein